MDRHNFLLKSAALGAVGAGFGSQFPRMANASSQVVIEGMPIPDVIEPGTGAIGKLDAVLDTKGFIEVIETKSQGFNQSYLGPVIRFKRGKSVSMAVTNRTDRPISAHWHGMHV